MTVIRRSASAVNAVEARRAESERYLQRLAALQTRIETELDQAFKMFGRVIARQYLVRLQTDIGNLRNLGAVLGTTEYSAEDLQKIEAAEGSLAALLQEVGGKLAKSKGQDWVDAMRSDLDAAITQRTTITSMDASRTEAVANLRSAVTECGSAGRRLACVASHCRRGACVAGQRAATRAGDRAGGVTQSAQGAQCPGGCGRGPDAGPAAPDLPGLPWACCWCRW